MAAAPPPGGLGAMMDALLVDVPAPASVVPRDATLSLCGKLLPLPRFLNGGSGWTDPPSAPDGVAVTDINDAVVVQLENTPGLPDGVTGESAVIVLGRAQRTDGSQRKPGYVVLVGVSTVKGEKVLLS